MPGDKGNTESRKVLLQPGRVSLLCWLSVLSAGWFFRGAAQVFWSAEQHKNRPLMLRRSRLLFRAADKFCLHSLSQMDGKCISRGHTVDVWRRDVQGLQVNQSGVFFCHTRKSVTCFSNYHISFPNRPLFLCKSNGIKFYYLLFH